MLQLPPGASVLLSAGAGIGKSSMAAITRPALWISTESASDRVLAMFSRLGVTVPLILPLLDSDPDVQVGRLKRCLADSAYGYETIIVVDSLTPFGVQRAVEVLNFVIALARERGWRVIFIAQRNQADGISGSAALKFSVDAICEIEQDPFNRRIMRLPKNRFGDLDSAYFEFGPDASLRVPPFGDGVAHSVEGSGTAFTLVPYGIRRPHPQYADLLLALAREKILTDFYGCASAAAFSTASRSGFIEPPDAPARQRFAEVHGMRWLSIEEGLIHIREARAEADSGKGRAKPDFYDDAEAAQRERDRWSDKTASEKESE